MAGKYFYQKISKAVKEDRIIEDFDRLLSLSTQRTNFSSSEELKAYIIEGTLLNVNSFGSKILSIPSGEYMVWMTNSGHTMLVPTAQTTRSQEVFEHAEEQYEVLTKNLLKAFVGVSKTLNEAADDEDKDEDEKKGSKETEEVEFTLTVDKSTVDRTPIMSAMENSHLTVTELAKLCGVDPPAISRILREPSSGPGDPGGRDPSIGLAARICSVLSMDPRSAFPDIFTRDKRSKPKEVKGNRASGSGTFRGNKSKQKSAL